MYITTQDLTTLKPKKKETIKDKITNTISNIFEEDSTELLSSCEFSNIKEFNEYKTSFFLSHKHEEIKELEMAVALFESLDIKIYIDWKDKQLPNETSIKTAEMIKNKIKECKKFIFIATQEAVESKWCNWELGYGDAIKFPNNIAIMPIANKNGIWIGTEYLNIYPIIKIHTEFGYCVEYKNKTIDLITWLTK